MSISLEKNGEKEKEEFPLMCGVCGKLYEEPRILPCLHTFCTKCIEGLDSYVSASIHRPLANRYHQLTSLSLDSNKDSAASGYESEKSPTSSLVSSKWSANGTGNRQIPTSRVVLCPTCDTEVDVPKAGASHLPLHYVLQSKIWQSSLTVASASDSHCDLCVGDVNAIAWCSECSSVLCAFCSEAHRRQRKTDGHKLFDLRDALRSGVFEASTWPAIRSCARERGPVCPSHPTEELRFFCETCGGTVCKDCCKHGGAHYCHPVCRVSQVATEKVQDLKNLLSQALPRAESLRNSLSEVRATSKQIENTETDVSDRVDAYIDGYIKSLEDHRSYLKERIKKTCDVKHRVLKLQSMQLEQALEDLETSCNFARQLLAEGSHVEVVTLAGHVGKRLRELGNEKQRLEPRVDQFLQFLPNEGNRTVDGYSMRGIVTAQRPCPSKCILKGNGLPVVRQGSKVDVILQTKDTEGQSMRRGGCHAKAELVSKEDPSRITPVKIMDRHDGTYVLSFETEQSGVFWLGVKIDDEHVQGSPYPLPVKAKGQSHSGIFHCCTFCSSGGSKEAKCGCGGTMQGGFKGCGHGHSSHPGKKHWSCCGRTSEAGDCSRQSTKIFQFTL